jgi:hydrogenase nickel incorporation protein HypA/HybF
MHELGIINNLFTIIEEVAEENHLIKVNNVKLKLGKLQQIVPEMLIFAFETVAEGTKAEGAALNVEYVPIKMKCATCSTEFIVEEHVYICPECSETNLTLLEGMEVILESLEGDQET